MQDSDILLVERDAGVAQVTLNRPDKMNALSLALRDRIATTFRELAQDGETRVVILAGNGRAFCAGLDLKEVGSGAARVGDSFAPEDNPVAAVAQFPGPVIGAINGVAITGGFELALACDVLIASTAARFADTHGRVGLYPGWGLSQRLSRIIGISRAKELSLTGNFLDAATAERWGLVNRVVEADALLPSCRALAQDMLSLVPGFLADYKRLIDDGYAMNFADAMKLEAEASHAFNSTADPGAVEARREAVRERGQAQTGI